MIYKLIVFISVLLFLIQQLAGQTLSFGTPDTVTTNFVLAKRINVVDIDADGDMDVIAASSNQNSVDDNIAWFENTGSGFVKHSVDTDFQGARTVDVGDFDHDGLLDIVGASRLSDPISWWENQSFTSWNLHTEPSVCDTSHVVRAADLNDDGYMDLVTGIGIWPNTSSNYSIGWFENNSASPGNFMFHSLSTNWQNIIDIEIVDLDKDGDKDIICVDVGIGDDIANDGVIWFENNNNSFTEREIDFSSLNPMYVSPGDVDNDGDIDILTVNWPLNDPPDRSQQNNIICYENDGKSGSDPTKVWTKHIIANDFYAARSGVFVDLDGDGNLDILGAACDEYHLGNGGYISYWINDGTPFNAGWQRTDIITNFDYAYHAVAVDMDDDGDLDIVGSAQNAGEILWWENQVSDDISNVTTSTDYSLWNNKINVNFSSGPSGSEYLKAYYNAGAVPNRSSLGSGIDHIAAKGYYTIKTNASSYTEDLQFSYSGISQWSAINNENDLILCYWSGTQWEQAGSQTINTTTDSILVNNFNRSSNSSVLWTLGSSSSDNSLPVELTLFKAKVINDGIELIWDTESETNNFGFELWRKSQLDTSFYLISDFRTNNQLLGLGTSSFGQEYNYVDMNVNKGYKYSYKLVDVSYDGKKFEHNIVTVNYLSNGLVFMSNKNLPANLVLHQNYPNPFNGKTKIEFSVPETNSGQNIQVLIFNGLGQKIKTLYNDQLSSGNYFVNWNGSTDGGQDVASGMYFYLLKSGINSEIKRMFLIK